MDVLVACLQVMLHARGPCRIGIHLRPERVRELERLTLILVHLVVCVGALPQLIDEERPMLLVLPVWLMLCILIGHVRAGFDLEADDTQLVGLWHFLRFHDEVPVVVEDVFVDGVLDVCLVDNDFADRDAFIVILVHMPGDGITHDDSSREPIQVDPVVHVSVDSVLERVILRRSELTLTSLLNVITFADSVTQE